MASVTGICNAALIKVGASVITSLDQGTKNANFCNVRYPEIRDKLLETHPWNFAVKTVKLAQLSATPVVKFDFAYKLPTDFIRALSVHDNSEGLGIADHKFRDGNVHSSSSELWLIYVSLVTDPNQMSPLFREALAAEIAVEAATAIAESNTLHELMVRGAKTALRRARSSDAMADLPDRMPVGSWMTGRTGRLAERKWSW